MTAQLRRPLSHLVGSALAVLALGACGAPAATGTPASPLTLLPSADAFHSAVVATRSMGTARLTIEVTRPSAQGSPPSHAAGPTVLGPGWCDLRWQTPQGDFRELVNSRGIYVTRDDRQWTQFPVSPPTTTSGYANALRGLVVLNDITETDGESTGGVPATTYRGWLPIDSAEAAQLGLTASERQVIGPEGREQVTAWVDDYGHVVRVDRSVADASGASVVAATTSMDDFSLMLDLASPSQNVVQGTTTAQ